MGAEEARLAFVKGVIEKLPEQQEELEWSQSALREDQRFQKFALGGLAVNALLLLSLGAMLAFRFFGSR
jgi:hypothetical protein